MLMLLPQILLLDRQVKDIERRTRALLQDTDSRRHGGPARLAQDLDLMLSIPGIGHGIAATIYGEASRLLIDRDLHALRCYAGTAPVTKQSARRKTVNMRHACSLRLRQAMHHWANHSIMLDTRSRQH